MLSLQLKSGDYFTIGDNITVQVLKRSSSLVRVIVEAPREIPVLRGKVHERTEERPEWLREKPPKSPSERKYDAKHFEEWTKKKELREQERQRESEEKAFVLRELIDITDRIDEIIAAHGTGNIQDKLTDLRSRLADLEDGQNTVNEGGTAEDE